MMKPGMNNPANRSPHTLTGTLPPLFDRRRGLAAVANLLVVAVLGLAGEWIVHQTEYFLVYGSRFGHVMATTPHRLYMGGLGLVLAAICLTVLTGFCLIVGLRARETRRLLAVLPRRAQSHLPVELADVAVSSIVATMFVLWLFQSVVYLIQENLESAAVGAGWPGLSVLIAPDHAAVLPLHLLVALCLSIVLWTVARYLNHSRGSVEAARLLVRLSFDAEERVVSFRPSNDDIPSDDRVALARSLRSP